MTGASASRGRPLATFAAIAAVTLALDQCTKVLALRHLHTGQSLSLLGTPLRLTLTHNTGSAFNLVHQSDVLLIGLGVLVCGGIAALVALRPDLQCCHVVPLALIWGGSMGNLLDRLTRGAVVDFVDLQVWPVFNVADVAITVGFVVLAIQLIRRSS
jgi:signal peptidase II